MPSDLKLGVMVEVPSLLWQLDEICRRVDFLSVGSNDLMQYLFAADRDNKRVFQPLRSLVGALPRRSQANRSTPPHAESTPVTLCGEIGGQPLEALALMALGYRGLSMSAASIGPVKAMVLATDLRIARAFVANLLAERSSAPSLRDALRKFAEGQGIPL